jgi:hypothetical protein
MEKGRQVVPRLTKCSPAYRLALAAAEHNDTQPTGCDWRGDPVYIGIAERAVAMLAAHKAAAAPRPTSGYGHPAKYAAR